jgi:TPR repeat protein
MPQVPQTNLRRVIGFDATRRRRQSNGMRVPVMLWLLVALPFPTAIAAPPMKWENLMLMKTAAEKGDTEAQYLLGLQYQAGDGIEKNPAEAAKWLRQAATQGHVGAQGALGALQAASGNADEVTEAAKWLQAASEEGRTEAMVALAALHQREGSAVYDQAEALRRYAQAADAGHAGAARTLAEMHVQGRGVARDLAQGLQWYRRAAELGDTGAKFILGRIEAVTKAVRADSEKALAWWRAEAEKGDTGAALALELLAAEPRAATDEDPAETVRWSLLLSGLRGAEAHQVRGYMLEHGIAVNRDLAAAIASYRKAAALGLPQAKEALTRLQKAEQEAPGEKSK